MQQAIDWPGIRAAAVVVGIRQAARQASANLTDQEQVRFVNRVLQRAHRENWTDAKAQSTALALQEKPLSSNVINGAQALQNVISDNSVRSKLGFSKASTKVAEHLAEQPAKKLMEPGTAQSAKAWVGVAAQSMGWQDQQQGNGTGQ